MNSTTKDSALPCSQWGLSQRGRNGSLELGQSLCEERLYTQNQNHNASQASGSIKRTFVQENAVFACTMTILGYCMC